LHRLSIASTANPGRSVLVRVPGHQAEAADHQGQLGGLRDQQPDFRTGAARVLRGRRAGDMI